MPPVLPALRMGPPGASVPLTTWLALGLLIVAWWAFATIVCVTKLERRVKRLEDRLAPRRRFPQG